MKQVREFISRFRLLWSLAALAVLLSALSVQPVRAEICEDACWGWNVQQGCTDCHHCCSQDDGSYSCPSKSDNNCGTGGPGLIN
jgi:hypothetical protein